MNKCVKKPNFLYIGPDKSGSSWLHKILASHPECYVPEAKDIYYFDENYERGEQWYLKFFRSVPSQSTAVGEISHGYLYNMEAPKRILKDFPEIKIMTTLRNPVERSISHYFYLRASGLINCDLQEALKIRPGIIRSSLYCEPLIRYIECFSEKQLHIGFFEQLKNTPRDYAFGVYQFLGLREIDCMDFEEKIREARKPKNVHLVKVLKNIAVRARNLGLPNLVGKIKHSNAIARLYEPLASSDRKMVTLADRNIILEKVIDDIESLEKLLRINLEHWKCVY